MTEYVIISLKWGTANAPVFWRTNGAGYTTSPFDAGRYSEDEVKKHAAYYNNGEDTIAIPLTNRGLEGIDFQCGFSVTKLLEFYKHNKRDLS